MTRLGADPRDLSRISRPSLRFASGLSGQGLWTRVTVLCGPAAWKPLVSVVAGVLFLLLAGGSIEQWCQEALGPPDFP
jgi:hypothetical protein